MNPAVRVVVTGIAAGGAGVGRLPDGRAVFVHRAAPGDSAEVRIVREKRRHAWGELLSIARPGPGRRQAPCPHYDRCGGCTIEHLEYPAQLQAKAAIAGDALRRIGGTDAANPAVEPSPDEFRYRNRVSFTLLRLGAGRVAAGFHEIGNPGRIVDITPECLLPETPVATVWGRMRGAWGPDASLLPSGRRLRITLRATANGDVTALVDGGFAAGRPDRLLQAVPGLVALWHRRSPSDAPELLAGNADVPEAWNGESLLLGGAVFLQVNRKAAARLEDHVLALAAPRPGMRIVDAYCGVGIHARRLARLGARVTGIELDPLAVAQARRNAPDGARFVAGRVEAELPALLPAALLIANPPRSGLSPEVVDILMDKSPDRMIYVSCDPATLARDIARMAGRFRIGSVRCFDLFPQTAHVETVVELTCATA